MFYFILVGLVLLWVAVAGALALHAPKEKSEVTYDRRGEKSGGDEITRGTWLFQVGLGVLVLALLTLMFAVTIVSPRTVGVYTSFGKEAGTKPAGLGWTKPWVSKAQEFPTNVQYLVLANGDKGEGATSVKYKGGGGGQVDATVRWSMDQKKVLDLWRQYREFNKVNDQLVKSAARDSIGIVVGAYAPSDATSGENRRKITDDIQADLNSTLSTNGIKVDSVSISDVRLDEKTQASIEAIVKANADIQRAQAEQARAKIDAATTEIRQKSGLLSPQGLQRYCLEITNAWNAGANGKLPETWNCGLGQQSTGVLVGNK